jgi:pyridoxal phosphate enzyme (YggS family)
MSSFEVGLQERLAQVRQRIARACAQAGRASTDVTLLAVSKTMPAAAVRAAAAAGQQAFGENYIQEALDKQVELADPALQWHCIGPVQSNKTRLVATHFDWMHTLERLKIAQRLHEQRAPALAPLQVCIQVNIDGGANKSGVARSEVLALARDIVALPRLQLRGLMAIPEPAPDFAAQLAVHRQVKALFDEVAAARIEGLARWDTLSIGMTADLEAAIHAGSTMVRIGTAIFGSRA